MYVCIVNVHMVCLAEIHQTLCARAVRVCGQTGSRSDQSDQQQPLPYSQRQVTPFERCWQPLGCVRDWVPLPGQCVSAARAAPDKGSRLGESVTLVTE